MWPILATEYKQTGKFGDVNEVLFESVKVTLTRHTRDSYRRSIRTRLVTNNK